MVEKFYVDDEEVEEEEFWSRLEEEVNYECEDNFDAFLDETENEVEICGYTFSPSEVLKEMDYTAYNCMLGDYQSNQLEDYKYDIELHGSAYVNGVDFRLEEVEEDED